MLVLPGQPEIVTLWKFLVMKVHDLAIAAGVMILWGLNLIVVRTGIQEIPPLFLTALRCILVAALMAPFFRPTPDKWPGILMLGIVMGVGHFGFMFLGLRGIDAVTGAVIIQLGVPFSAMLAWLIFGDRLGGREVLGLGLAFGGVAVLAGESKGGDPLSFGFIVAAAAMWAVSNVIVKRLTPIPPAALNGWASLCAVPALLGLSAVFEHGQKEALAQATWHGWGAVFYTACGSSIVAYTLWYRLIATYSLNRIIPLTLLAPVIGMAGGIFLLGEPLTRPRVVGGLMTMAGVAICLPIRFRSERFLPGTTNR